MTPGEFKTKWSRVQGKETSAYQEHFIDLCRLLGQPTPNEADPSGTDLFCFQKRVVKDAELFDRGHAGRASRASAALPTFGKKAVSAGNTKAKRKISTRLTSNCSATARRCKIRRCSLSAISTATSSAPISTARFRRHTNSPTPKLTAPKISRLLRALFEIPIFSSRSAPRRKSRKNWPRKSPKSPSHCKSRESVELADAKTRKEMNVAQKKNLRIARFLNRIVFCFFAEDTGLLPEKTVHRNCQDRH